MVTKKEEKESLEVMKIRLTKQIKRSTWETIILNIAKEIGMGFNTREGRKKDEAEKDKQERSVKNGLPRRQRNF